MYIHEAIQATTIEKPYITRRSWSRLSAKPNGGIKIQPTNSPDCCIVMSDAMGNPRRGWEPRASDLAAYDWEPVK